LTAALEEELSTVGYEVRRATPSHAAQAVAEFAPDVALVVPRADEEGFAEASALARRWRMRPETYALPVVFLYQRDERSLRGAALQIGVDDYLALATPRDELRTRLDSLFWRVEAGRRSAPLVAEQRSEIDNFLLVVDAVTADAESGTTGALALVSDARGASPHLLGADSERLLAEAYGFFKLQLRRLDAVTFYGPTILLVYLPGQDATAAHASLMALRRQFSETRPAADLAVGISSFPADGTQAERLIEHAEAALNVARTPSATARVVAHGVHEPGASGDVRAASDAEGAGAQRREPFETSARTRRDTDALGRAVREKRAHDDTEIAAGVASQTGARAGGGSDGGRGALSGAALEAVMRERERRAAGGASMPRRLLLTVSDAARMAQLNLLIRSAGYEVRAAFDGQQALNLLRIERPDLLLVDFELHDMDGLEMLRRLRKQTGGDRMLPFVLLLPSRYESSRDVALEEGAHDIIMLPCEPAQLLDAVRVAGTSALER
ncbi:MAG TPA: response regulator, partial [Pyrinomonadaceae bacterium]|nr:response regulator [Pyrinomonadaceae bacterium]